MTTHLQTDRHPTWTPAWLRLASLLALLAVAGLVPALAAHEDAGAVLPGESFALQDDDGPIPAFARVRYVENGLSVEREDGIDEIAAFNTPVYQGDTLSTGSRQRGEIQLPDGSLLRIDRNTRVELFAMSGDSHALSDTTILAVQYGAIQVDVPDPAGGEGFRVDTASASIYPLEPSALRIDVRRDDDVSVVVESGRVEVSGATGSEILVGGEATYVLPGRAPRAPRRAGLVGRDDFDAWVARRDDGYRLRSRPGRELGSLPRDVRPYYAELSRYGEWAWTDDYGWAWMPGVDDDWRPYTRGYWDPGPYGPVWIAHEPWGWPVYRYGRWDWSVRFGWAWIPGSVFRPAHVSWYYGPSYIGWCPLGYYDVPVRLSLSFGWGHRYFHHSPWVFTHFGGFYHRHGGYILGYGHGHGGRHRHASELRSYLAAGRGVVTRRAVHRDAVGRSGAASLPRDTLERAARLRTARRIDRPADIDAPRRPFRDAEGARDTARAPAQRRRGGAATSPRAGERSRTPRRGGEATAPTRRDPRKRPIARVFPGGRPDFASGDERATEAPGRAARDRRDRGLSRPGAGVTGPTPTRRRLDRDDSDERAAPPRSRDRGRGKRTRPAAAPRRGADAGERETASGVRRMLGGVASPRRDAPARGARPAERDRRRDSRGVRPGEERRVTPEPRRAPRGERAEPGRRAPSRATRGDRPARRPSTRPETRGAPSRRERPSGARSGRPSGPSKSPGARSSRPSGPSKSSGARSRPSGRSKSSGARGRSSGSPKSSGARGRSSGSKSSGGKGRSSRRR